MVKNNILLAFRQLKKNKVFSLINILGLSLSMVACLLIFNYISFEKSYDNYHQDVDELYRIYRASEVVVDGSEVASVFPGIAPLSKAEIPEFVQTARFIGSNKIFQSFAFTHYPQQGTPKTFNITEAYFADDDALSIFGFQWSDDSYQPSLAQPNEVIISRSIAQKFFGDADAVGQTLQFKNMQSSYKVTGVFEDLPQNSHFKFDVLCSMKSLPEDWDLDTNFGWGNFYTYVRLDPQAELPVVEEKLNKLLENRETWYAEEQIVFLLQPVKDIHLKSEMVFELEANGDETTVIFLSIIGLFIMLIAWVNYINLSTSKLVDRAKEVGIRKVLGSYRTQLMYQFITESVLINLLATVLAVTLLQASIDFFEALLGIPLDFFGAEQIIQTFALIGAFALGSVLFGFYPALLFSRLKVAAVLKGRSRHTKSGLQLRRMLTVFQFVIALVLVTGTLAVYQQLTYMQQKSLGMDIDQTLIVRKPYTNNEQRAASEASFTNSVKQIAGVRDISASSEIPGYEISYMRWVALGTLETSPSIYAKDIAIDEQFMELYDIEVLHGRNFSEERQDTASLILSEQAALNLFPPGTDLASMIDQTVYHELVPHKLVGIVSDISQRSIKNLPQPHIYTHRNRTKFFSIKLKVSELQSVISQVESAFGESFVTSHFDYFFLDEYFNRQYKSDRLFGKIFAFFSILAIVVTILGLFGLSLYNITQRAKEVSIRKVLGASLQSLSVLLTKEYLYLIVLSALISVPLAYFLVDQWLTSFPNRMEISSLMFILPVAMVAVLTIATVGYQVVKAALANPAETLRWE